MKGTGALHYGGLTNSMSLQPHVVLGVKMEEEWMGEAYLRFRASSRLKLLMKLLPFFAFSFSEPELTHCRSLNGHETQLLGSGKPRRWEACNTIHLHQTLNGLQLAATGAQKQPILCLASNGARSSVHG
jgi:hypothetical protein